MVCFTLSSCPEPCEVRLESVVIALSHLIKLNKNCIWGTTLGIFIMFKSSQCDMNSKQNHNLNVFTVEFQKAITIYAPEGTCVHARTHTHKYTYMKHMEHAMDIIYNSTMLFAYVNHCNSSEARASMLGQKNCRFHKTFASVFFF